MIIGCCVNCCVGCFIQDLYVKHLKRRWRTALALWIYTFAFGLMIWATVEANTNPNHAYIITKGYFNPIAGIIFGIGFLPVILMILALAILTLIVIVCIVCFISYVLLVFIVQLLVWCKCPYSKRLYDAVPAPAIGRY